MKKRKIILIILLIGGIFFLNNIQGVNADSGWDSSYDSGSDYDSSYDSWSDDDSSFSSSTNNEDPGSMFFALAFFIIFFIVIIGNNTGGKHVSESKVNQLPISDEEVQNKLGITAEEFKKKALDIYVNIQNAWSNFEYDELRKYTTDEIYNMYVMQLEALKTKQQKNVMENIECVDLRITKIEEVNGITSITVYMHIKMYDYVIDNNNTVVRGTNSKRISIEYEITFVKAQEEIIEKENKCPNCGAEIKTTTGGSCPYCRTNILTKPKTYVMSRKKNINQRMED